MRLDLPIRQRTMGISSVKTNTEACCFNGKERCTCGSVPIVCMSQARSDRLSADIIIYEARSSFDLTKCPGRIPLLSVLEVRLSLNEA